MNISNHTSDKELVLFTGASESQVRWGNNDDPNKILSINETYEIEEKEVHSWHTKIKLVGKDGWFNDVSFKYLMENSDE